MYQNNSNIAKNLKFYIVFVKLEIRIEIGKE